MADDRLPVLVEWTIDCEAGAEFAVATLIDSVTQSTYCLRIPLHALASFRQVVSKFLSDNPDLFGGIDTRPLG